MAKWSWGEALTPLIENERTSWQAI